jgi:hypothetical protein
MSTLLIVASIISALVGAGVGAVTSYVALRKNGRDEAGHTIGLLREQNQLLRDQLAEAKRQTEAREAEWRKREGDWQKREDKLEARIETLEAWQRDEIGARSRLQMCRKAPECTNYDPGVVSVGGTD